MTEVNVPMGDVAERHDLKSILSGEGRDFLVRNNDDQVKVSSLEGKIVGLYFSASWCGRCQEFTPKLAETYSELSSQNADFEVVFVPADNDEESFCEYFSEMPWLAIPFSDSTTRSKLDELFTVRGIPDLVILDKNGVVVNDEGVQAVREYGSEAYPFTQERIETMKAEEEGAKKNLPGVLATYSRGYLVSKSGNKVPISELEGKIVGLYFSSSYRSYQSFTEELVDMYEELKEKGADFEVVLVSLDDDKPSFQQGFAGMPWLAIPFNGRSREKLAHYFELETVPTLVIIGADGKTLISNAAELVEEHGSEAYPFSPEKLEELAEKEKAKLEAQTLESLLVSGEHDYVIGKGGAKVPVSELVGKNILLSFSAHWCLPCCLDLQTLIEAYNKIKAKDPGFEIVFISNDRDQASFDDYFALMPWLAVPFGDERTDSLFLTFKIQGIPSLVAIGPTGKTVTKDAKQMIKDHGADAYPFTEERIKELEAAAAAEKEAKQGPEKKDDDDTEVEIEREGYVCEGDVCYKKAKKESLGVSV